jgi:hypothetical protein
MRAATRRANLSFVAASAAEESPLLTGLIHYWTLNETTGDRADSVGSLTLTPDSTASYGTGKQDNALDLELSSGEFLNSSTVVSMIGDWTVAFWIKPESYPVVTEYHGICRLGSVWGGGGGPEIKSAFTIQIALLFYQGANNDSVVIHSSSSEAGNWCFIAFSHDATGKELLGYYNGEYSDGTTYSFAPAATTVPFHLGYGSSHCWDGLIDEFGIWERVLSEEEIVQLYNAGDGLTYPFTS